MAPSDENADHAESLTPAANRQTAPAGKSKTIGVKTTAPRRTSVTLEDVAPDWHLQRAGSKTLPRVDAVAQLGWQLPRSHSTFSTEQPQIAYGVKHLESSAAAVPVCQRWLSSDSRSPRSSVSSVVIATTSTPTRFLTPGQPLAKVEKMVTCVSSAMKLPAAAAAKEGVTQIAQLKEFKPKMTSEQASTDEDALSEDRSDLDGLIEYLDAMTERNVRFTEVTYVVNAWMLGGIIPLKHHGFILKTEDDYLTVDFTRRGIIWDTFDEFPDLPDGTMYSKTHAVKLDPAHLKFYCQTTKPFAWPGNDCSHWARGLLQIMMVREDPHGDHGAFPEFSKLNSTSCSGAGGFNPLSLLGIGCFSS